MLEPLRESASRSTHVTVTERLRARGKLEQAGGPAAVDLLPPPPDRRQRCASTRRSCARTRCCGGCSTRPTRSSRSVLDHEGAAARRSSTAPSARARGRPRRPQKDFRQGPRRCSTASSTSCQELVATRTLADRHAVRLQRPRRGHRRLPARQPDHHRRAPGDGQVGPRHEHRRERRAGHGKPVALFSLEMSEAELAQRFVASQANDQGRRPAPGPRATSGAGRRSSTPSSKLARRAAVRRRLLRRRHCSRSAPRRGGCTSRARTASAS